MSSIENNDAISALLRRDRATLGRVITLLESTLDARAREGQKILGSLEADSDLSPCVGITGPPGVGKSSFVEALGMELISRGHSVCALTVDPSSLKSRGSILGDKTRMEKLGKEPQAYIRSSPSGTEKGGLSARSYDVLSLCRKVGFDFVLLETVGAGQSELDVHRVTDFAILLTQPGGGDDLQGIKKGIMEIADLLLVTKADGELLNMARESVRHLRHSLQILRSSDPAMRKIQVRQVSSHSHQGISDVLDQILDFFDHNSAGVASSRREQDAFWLEHKVKDYLQKIFFGRKPHQETLRQAHMALAHDPSRFYEILYRIQSYIDDQIR